MVASIAPTENWSIEQIVAADAKHLVHPLQSPSDHPSPLVLARGEGIELIDVHGKRYIDGLSGLWNVAVGHGRAELAAAAARQMETLAFASSYAGFVNLPSVQLADRLAALSYPNLNAVYFTTAGAESNESAFKIARFFWKLKGKPEKFKVLSRKWGYHGVTMAAASATGLPMYHKMFAPLVPGFPQAIGPYRFRCDLEAGGEPRPCTLPGQHDFAADLESTLLAEGPESVAAIIAEPVQGAGGVIAPPEDYWPKLRAIADRNQVLLIADEIITGFGRTGRWFALEHWNVQPDLMTFAKAVTSAYAPLGGVMLSDEVHRAIQEAPADLRFTHAATYSGHPMCCAVALANLNIIESEGLVEKADEDGPWFIRQLTSLMGHSSVGDVRGLGLMAAVELVVPERQGAAFYDAAIPLANDVMRECISRGLIPRLRGNCVVLAPPLIATREQLARIVSILGDSIQAAATRQGIAKS